MSGNVEPAGADLEYCYDAVGDVSRTFALTVAELDEPMARDICVGYLLCRVADTIEDAGHVPPGDQQELLTCYSRALDTTSETTVREFRDAVEEWIPADPNADWTVVESVTRVHAAFETLDPESRGAIRPHVRELVDGMAMFVERYADEGGLRLRTVDELEEYCWYAAGTVGALVTNLLVRDVEESVADRLRSNARAFAMLLQLVNVTKDVVPDYEEENNVYLPLELLSAENLDPSDIADPGNGPAFVPVVETLVARAEGYLDGAQAWLDAMPETRGNTLSAWAIPYLLAVATLRELDERPADVVREGDVKVTRTEVHELLNRFSADATPCVADLRSKMRRRPLDEW